MAVATRERPAMLAVKVDDLRSWHRMLTTMIRMERDPDIVAGLRKLQQDVADLGVLLKAFREP